MGERLVALWTWLDRHPRRALAICLITAAAMRLPFVDAPLGDDEGGFLMVAGQWHGRGDALYTNQWVDRPPLLLLVFKLAYLLGASFPVVRLVGLVLGSVLIVAAWYAGAAIGGARGAVAAAAVATCISPLYLLSGFQLTGELIAGSFVMVSCALVLQAMYGGRSTRHAVLLAFFAGIFASFAFLTKQNFIDAGVFAAVLLCVESYRAWRLLVSGLAGLILPLLVTVLWANSADGPGLSRLWVAIFKFRKHSLRIIEHGSLAAPLERLKWMVVLFVATGMLFLVCQLVVAVRKSENSYGLRIALVVMLLYAVLSIGAGASYWSHYLLQLVPVLAMGAALATRRTRRWLGGYAVVTYCLLASVLTALFGIETLASGHEGDRPHEIMADYLREGSEPGDSVMLAYGSPSVIEMSGLSTPYMYSWSLPIRARDPHLTSFVNTLDGRNAPTWLVEVGDFDWWGLDTTPFKIARADRYRVVATVCGHDFYLHDGLTRTLPPTPAC
jgi:4-amino-4-deoxy-L-arabinose transferase-like glycosyltransferase